MNNNYDDSLTIDRINVNGNYEPNNCRWVSIKEQASNTRATHLLTYNGEIHALTEWSRITGVSPSTISQRISRGWSIERALTEPTNK